MFSFYGFRHAKIFSLTVVASVLLFCLPLPPKAQAAGIAASISVVQAPYIQSKVATPVSPHPGATFITQPIVRFLDSDGKQAGNTAPVTASMSSPVGGSADGVLVGIQTVVAVNGVATFTNLSIAGGNRLGYSFTFSSPGFAPTTIGVNFATKLMVYQAPMLAGPGEPLAVQPKVYVSDAFGNIIKNASASAPISVGLNQPSGPSCFLSTANLAASYPYRAYPVDGIANFSDLVLDHNTDTAGCKLLFYSGSILASLPISDLYFAPAKLTVKIGAVAGTSGRTFTTMPQISQLDADGHTARYVDDKITVTVSEGQLAGTTTVTLANGSTTFTNLTLSGELGKSYTLLFTSANGYDSVSQSVTLANAGPAAALVFSTQPVASTRGNDLKVQPVVSVTDIDGNPVSSNAIIFLKGSTSVVLERDGLSLPTTGRTPFVSIQAVNGVASFTGLALNGNGGGRLTAWAESLQPSKSAVIVFANANSAKKLKLNATPVAKWNGASYDVHAQVSSADTAGNYVLDASDLITVSASGATLSGSRSVSLTSGKAVFSDLQLTTPSLNDVVLTFASTSGLQSVTSALTDSKPSRIAFRVEPVASYSGQQLQVQPVLELQNQLGQVFEATNYTVIASLLDGSLGTVFGETQVNFHAGLASFTKLGLTSGSKPVTVVFVAKVSGSDETFVTAYDLQTKPLEDKPKFGFDDFTLYNFIAWNNWRDSDGKVVRSTGLKTPWNINQDFSDYLQGKKVKPVWVVYERHFSSVVDGSTPLDAFTFTAEDKKTLRYVDELKIREIALESAKRKDLLVSFDTEFGNRWQPSTVVPAVLEIVKTFKKYNSKTPVGVYALAPQVMFAYTESGLGNLKALNESYRPIAEVVDFLSPQIYIAYNPLIKDWLRIADYSMQESKRYALGKPIIPYMSFDVPSPTSQIAYQEAVSQMDYIFHNGAVGEILWAWSGATQVFDGNVGWGKAMFDVATNGIDKSMSLPNLQFVADSKMPSAIPKLSSNLTIQVRDPLGVVPVSDAPRYVSVTSSHGVLSGQTTVEILNSVATFSDLQISGVQAGETDLTFENDFLGDLVVKVQLDGKPATPVKSGATPSVQESKPVQDPISDARPGNSQPLPIVLDVPLASRNLTSEVKQAIIRASKSVLEGVNGILRLPFMVSANHGAPKASLALYSAALADQGLKVNEEVEVLEGGGTVITLIAERATEEILFSPKLSISRSGQISTPSKTTLLTAAKQVRSNNISKLLLSHASFITKAVTKPVASLLTKVGLRVVVAKIVSTGSSRYQIVATRKRN